MGRIFTSETEALLREKYEPVYKNGELTNYTDENGHFVKFYINRSGKSFTWEIYRERHDGEQLNDEAFVRGKWQPETSLYRWIHDMRVDDATLEEVIETAKEIDKAFVEYAKENPQDD